ncbi:hypothetical protein DL767_001577 [Monosporascus sp. MG133]|nr:hypothetical protein DL767_001577 [Monosporascus sp. MG133]
MGATVPPTGWGSSWINYGGSAETAPKSSWGTLAAPTLPLWVIGHSGQGDHGGPERSVTPPDGFRKSVLLVNKQFPAPLIEANWGDWIEGRVNDWWHEDYFTIVKELVAPGFPGQAHSDSNLTNGRMSFNYAKEAAARTGEVGNNGNTTTTNDSMTTTTCPGNAGLSKFRFQGGKRHRLRFINNGSEGMQRVSLDGHAIKVITQNFTEVKPICSLARQPLALAAVYYDGADDTDALPDSIAWDIPDPGT